MTAGHHNPPASDARAMVAQILTRRPNQSKIATNPDLQAFIHARISTAAFASVTTDAAAGFASETHISIAGMHRWSHAPTFATNRQQSADPRKSRYSLAIVRTF